MPYTKNPHMPAVRREAVKLFRKGWSARKIGRYLGFHHTAVMKWVKKAPKDRRMIIPTRSSRPNSHPKALDKEIVNKIIEKRRKHGRCAEVVYEELITEGIKTSLSSVKRTLDRHYLTKKRNKHKRLHLSPQRPKAAKPGDLVQVDTIHLMKTPKERLYIYTLLDVHSRWAFAWAAERANTRQSISFVQRAAKQAPFLFQMLQSDNGSEFSTHFSERIKITHRHSRMRRPNDNAHLERFNRTIQEELLNKLPKDPKYINKALPGYLKYYNEERLHLGINLKTPLQWCQGIE